MNEQRSAFDFLTRCLRTSCESDWTAVAVPAPDQEGFWGAVIELANRHLLTPALWMSLQRSGLQDKIPDDLRSYLEYLHGLSEERNAAIRKQTLEVVRALNAEGIEPVLLKGVVHLFTDTYGDGAVRIMTDIDILVEPEKFDTSLDLLFDLGYQTEPEPSEKYLTHRHCAPLSRPGDICAVEVHRDALSGQSAHILPSDIIWENLEPITVGDAMAKVMRPTYRVLHTILHSELTDRYHAKGVVALRYVHEVATMDAVYGDQIGWKQLEQLMQNESQAQVLKNFLYTCHKLFGLTLPRHIHFGMKCRTHYARCQLQLRYASLNRLVLRIDRWFSRYSIIRRYGYPDSLFWIVVGRFRVLSYLLCCFGRRLLKRPAETG